MICTPLTGCPVKGGHITRMGRMVNKKKYKRPGFAQLKLVYTANTTLLAEAALYNFLGTWSSKYPKIKNTLSDILIYPLF